MFITITLQNLANQKTMPKIIEKYCFIQIPGGEYILHTKEPFLIGRVWLYKSLQALTEQIEKLKPLSFVQMENYSIAITLWAVLGDRVIIHSGSKEEIKKLMAEMLEFYKEDRKIYSTPYYLKFKF